MDENQLLEHIIKAQNGGQQAFMALYDEYKNLVYYLLKSRIKNDSDIQEGTSKNPNETRASGVRGF